MIVNQRKVDGIQIQFNNNIYIYTVYRVPPKKGKQKAKFEERLYIVLEQHLTDRRG